MKEYSQKEELAKMMFDKLREHIGDEVSYEFYSGPYKRNSKGKIKEVNDFDTVMIDKIRYPFIGYGVAVYRIMTIDGEILYENKNINSRYGIDSNLGAINTLFEKTFGSRIANFWYQSQESRRRIVDEYAHNLDYHEYASTVNILTSGAPKVIKPEMLNEWVNEVRKMSDGMTLFETKAAYLMMEEFERGISFSQAEEIVYDKELNISGEILTRIAKKIIRFSKYGNEYSEYWNNNYYSNSGMKKH